MRAPEVHRQLNLTLPSASLLSLMTPRSILADNWSSPPFIAADKKPHLGGGGPIRSESRLLLRNAVDAAALLEQRPSVHADHPPTRILLSARIAMALRSLLSPNEQAMTPPLTKVVDVAVVDVAPRRRSALLEPRFQRSPTAGTAASWLFSRAARTVRLTW